MEVAFRILKSIAMSLILFVSAIYITGNTGMAFILALVPLVLGWMGILVGPTYMFVAVVFIAAVGWALVPQQAKAFLRDNASAAANTIKNEITIKPE